MLIFKNIPKDFSNSDIISYIYVIHNNKVLFLKYNKAKTKINIGKWTIVSGKNRNEEDELSCAIRELKEETGILCKKEDLIHSGKYFYKGNVNRVVYDFILYLSDKPNVKLSDEHTEYKWIDINDIENLDIVRGRREILKYNKYDIFNKK